jgi:hypothetical protein
MPKARNHTPYHRFRHRIWRINGLAEAVMHGTADWGESKARILKDLKEAMEIAERFPGRRIDKKEVLRRAALRVRKARDMAAGTNRPQPRNHYEQQV